MHIKRIGMIVLCALLILANGCAIRRPTDGITYFESSESETEETGKIYLLKEGGVSFAKALDVFLGKTFDECQQYLIEPEMFLILEIGEEEFTVGHNHMAIAAKDVSSDTVASSFKYLDYHENACACYSAVIGAEIAAGREHGTLREIFPEEDLDSCTKEEAIEACRPYAEAVGYGDAAVSVYAVTLDILEKNATQPLAPDSYSSAPDPDHEHITYKQIADLRAEGKDAEADELSQRRGYVIRDSGNVWEKKHEAMVLVYQPYVDGHLMRENIEFLTIIYSPLYDKIVWLRSPSIYEVEQVVDEKKLISKDEALAMTMQIKGVSSVESMKDCDISLIYALQSEPVGEYETMMKAIPCWKVEYTYKTKFYSVMIDAVWGDEYQKYIVR